MSEQITPPHPSLIEACRYWFKLGWISFGGPAGQISMMHDELVERRRWISPQRFLHALNYTLLLPGPEAQQLATYLGWLLHGTRGGLIAGLLFILPSLVLLIALSWAYLRFGQLAWVAGLFYGIKPAVVAIIAFAAWRLGRRRLNRPFYIVLALAAFCALFFFALPFPWLILAAAIAGVVATRWFPDVLNTAPTAHAAAHAPQSQQAAAYLFDDHTPPPAHAYFCRRHTMGYLVMGISLWLLVMAALYQWQSSQSQAWVAELSTLGLFFTRAALVTFGGAYAVLPYVFQAAVVHYAWLGSHQMIDGLALGESTPGPLIMVLVFVGFLATAQQAPPQDLLWAGSIGALVVCFFTFLPSFVFIFIGAPMVEASRRQGHWHGPLNAISAAVVGVIVQLALVFALQVLWPAATAMSQTGIASALWHGASLGACDWIALALLLLATALQWRGWSVVQVLIPCALIGGLIRLFA